MKFDPNKTFPYPVLRHGSDDYLESEFQVIPASIQRAQGTITIPVHFDLSSEEMLQLIKDNKAAFMVIVSCRATFMRRSKLSFEPEVSVSFNEDELRGEVLINSYVVAIDSIEDYQSSEINPEFGSDTFSFEPGFVLAQDEPYVVYIDKEVYKPVRSVVRLAQSDQLSEGVWQVDLDGPNITILVNPVMKEKLDLARNSKTGKVILLNALWFPAIQYTLERLREDVERRERGEIPIYEQYTWAQVFYKALHNQGIDISAHSSYLVAQRLLKHPLNPLYSYVFKNGENS